MLAHFALLISSIHCPTVFPEALAQKWTPRNWLWPNSFVFGLPHFWQRYCSESRFRGNPRWAASSSAFLRRQAVVRGTFGLGNLVAAALCSGSGRKVGQSGGLGPPITTLITSPYWRGSGTLCGTGSRSSEAIMWSMFCSKTKCSCPRFLALYLFTEEMIQ